MIYVQGKSGLTPVSPSLTKEKIIAALGYTPVDNNTFYEDESGALIVTDEKGYVIARIDENGLQTTQVSTSAVVLNGEDLATKLQSLADKVPEIDLSNYYTKKQVDDVINQIDIPKADLSGYATEEYVQEALAGIEIPDNSEHFSNNDIHVTAEEKATWNNALGFSGDYNDLYNAPHIVNDNENEVVVCDTLGNVILRATAEGLNVAAVYVNGKAVSFPDYTDADEGKTLKIVNGVPAWV